MSTFLNDTFTESSTTALTSHTGETGATWTLHPSYSAVQSINASGRLYNPSSSGYGAYSSGAPASADYSVFGTLYCASNLTNSRMGVCGRMSTSANTMYVVQYEQAAGGWKLYKFVNGSSTQLGSTATQALTVGNSYQVELRMSGTSISAYVDGSLVIGPVTDSAISAAGQAGVRSTVGSASTGYQLDAIWAVDSSSGVTGTCSQSQSAQSESASGTLSFSGVLAQSQKTQSVAASGTLKFTGTVSQTQAKQTQYGTQSATSITGAVAQQQPRQQEQIEAGTAIILNLRNIYGVPVIFGNWGL